MSAAKSLQTAIGYLDNGDWEAAHKIVQSDDSSTVAWVHGIVHVMEGDLNNARYWYERAGRVFSDQTAKELAAMKEMLRQK